MRPAKQSLPLRVRLHPWKTIRALSRDVKSLKSEIDRRLADREKTS
jgi:hypothetical protein